MVAQLRRDCGDTGNSGGVSGDRVSGDSLSVVQLAMIEAFSGLSVQLDALNTDVLLGKPVDQGAYCQLITTMVRVGSRLGVRRKPRDVIQQSLAAYLDNPERPEMPEGGERPPRIGREPLVDDAGDSEAAS
jgi:hypothetical protein